MDINEKIRARRAKRNAQKNTSNRNAVRDARGRFNDAIRSGLSTAEATAYANGKAKPQVKKPEPVKADKPDIPDDWEKMHWRTQVKLAESITGKTIPIDSEAASHAKEIIAQATQG